jgi:hypothetical protein
MKFINFFLCLWVIFDLNPDPDPIMNPDTDPGASLNLDPTLVLLRMYGLGVPGV